MKVIRKSGNRNSWQEMDIESRQAVYLAERLVEDKRGVETGGKTLQQLYAGDTLWKTYL